MVTGEMSPYLLLGFLIAGILHVAVPQRFYTRFLSRDNKFSVLWAALLGIPLPLCSCGVIPTAIGLRNEKASKGAVASFLIATPQTGIDSILATFSVLGLGFAIIRPAAALVTGVCGGLLVNLLVKEDSEDGPMGGSCRALEDVEGVESAKASATRNTLTIKGPAPEAAVRAAVEKAGYTFKGRKV